MKKKNYWTETEDDLCHRWVVASTEKEYQSIYLRLEPKIRKMTESILKRYFTFNSSLSEDYIQEAIVFVFLKLEKYNHNKRGRNRWYSYVQTIIKNRLSDLIIYNKNDNEITTDEIYDNVDDYNLYWQSAIEFERMRENTIDYLRQKGVKIKRFLKSNGKSLTDAKKLKYEKEINYIKLLIKYIKRYDGINSLDLISYMVDENDLLVHDVFTFSKKYIGISVNRNAYYDTKNN